MKGLEFWIIAITDAVDENDEYGLGSDLHTSEIIWGDGMTPKDVMDQAWQTVPGLTMMAGQQFEVHGPYFTNDVLVKPYRGS